MAHQPPIDPHPFRGLTMDPPKPVIAKKVQPKVIKVIKMSGKKGTPAKKISTTIPPNPAKQIKPKDPGESLLKPLQQTNTTPAKTSSLPKTINRKATTLDTPTPPIKPTIIPASQPLITAPPSDPKLFVLKNGELKTIKKSNISSSGIIKFIPNKPPTTVTPLRPICSNYIINNDIDGGVMTMEQYRHQVDTHRKNQILERAAKAAEAVDPVTIYKVVRPNDIDLDSNVVEPVPTVTVQKNKPGRKKGVSNKKEEKVTSILEPVSGSRTRSGRVSRPPRHIQRFYMKDPEANTTAPDPDGIDHKNTGFYCEEDSIEEPPAMKKQKRPIGGERLKCDQCGKSYFNERKLQQHLHVAHEMGGSDLDGHGHHVDNDTLRIDCFNFMLGRLKKVPMNLRGKVFLDEMEAFVKKMHRLVEKLIKRKTASKTGFLNYSQVHQVPKVLEAVLNVPSGQYHFDTTVIDADEKTILEEGNNGENGNGVGLSGNRDGLESHNTSLGVLGSGESALSGFDDSSTQPTMIRSREVVNDDNARESAIKETVVESTSFADHIISLEDAIYGHPVVTGDLSLSGVGTGDEDKGPGRFYEDNDDDDEEEEDDDLTTPKKLPQPSPIQGTRKLKRVSKNLNKINSFPVAGEGDASHHILQGTSGSRLSLSHGAGTVVTDKGMTRPVIKDLSMELFRSPDITGMDRRTGGSSGGGI